MSIEKMRLVKINGDNERLDELITAILGCGCFQPEPAGKYFSSSLGFLPNNEENRYSQMLSDIQSLLNEVGHTLSFDADAAKEPLTDDEIEHIKELRHIADKYTSRSAELSEQRAKCEEGLTKYAHFTGLSVELDKITELEYVRVRFGHMPKESLSKLNVVFERCPYFYYATCSTDKTDDWGVYFAPRNRIDEVDGIFASLLFEPIEIPSAAGSIANIMTAIDSNLQIIAEEEKELLDEANAIWKTESELANGIFSKLSVLDSAYQLKSYTIHNPHYFMMAGWVPQSDEKDFLEAINKIDGVSAETGDADPNRGEPPVKIKSLWKPLKYLVDPYRFYIDMYGTPSYKDIDVTAFVAVTYTILFGVMFGDMGHGLVLSIVGYLMYKLKKMEIGRILIPCGISSIVFGFIFGSVFGFEDLLDPVYKAIGLSGKPVSVMDSVNSVLLVTLVIGIVLTTLSMLLNVYGCIKNKRFGEAIFSNNGLTGIAVYLCGANLASRFMGGFAPIPSGVAAAVIGVGAVLLLVKEILIGAIDKHKDFMPESITDFILQNFFELIEYILSYLSNTLSFLRIGAYVLVHAGMMLAVFALAGENKNAIILIFGNIFVIAVEGLLTAIQVLRLEFYEMFSRFYGGDGKPFIPFTDKQFSIGGNKNEKN
ncbi:MAG: hypothetical protein J1F23_05530 [Oscillospiraceae bacterium]|nr:hypothetical protein [Oscillospiraceae bacterium]